MRAHTPRAVPATRSAARCFIRCCALSDGADTLTVPPALDLHCSPIRPGRCGSHALRPAPKRFAVSVHARITQHPNALMRAAKGGSPSRCAGNPQPMRNTRPVRDPVGGGHKTGLWRAALVMHSGVCDINCFALMDSTAPLTPQSSGFWQPSVIFVLEMTTMKEAICPAPECPAHKITSLCQVFALIGPTASAKPLRVAERAYGGSV